MKVTRVLPLILLLSFISYAQIPIGYYTSAENNADNNLKYALNQIIDNHTEFPYTSSSTDVWDILKQTDKDPNNSSNVILIYSGVSVNAAQEYSNGSGWTREHVWAKSRGNFDTDPGPGTDVHALRPLDNTTNGTRNNRGFDNCNDCSIVYDQWSNNTGSMLDNTAWSFEPRPIVKGDVARMIFYMAVRYEGYDAYPDLEVSETILPISDSSPFHGVLSTLIDWHRNDPVDAWEENRNDIIYNNYQNNRNPFIDYPELVEHLWGNQIGVAWQSSLSVNDFNQLNIVLYPNPVSNYLHVLGLNDKVLVEVFDVVGKKILSKQVDKHQNIIDVSKFNQGLYFFKITSKNKSITKQIVVL